MTRCPNCNAEVPDNARFCPHCGIAQPRRPTPLEQPPLPFSPWGPPPAAARQAGVQGGARSIPAVGTPLTPLQVGIAVGAILLFLAFVVIVGRGGLSSMLNRSSASTAKAPVVGAMGEELHTGKTAWGVAFTDEISRVDNKPPQHGQYFAVAIVVGNNSDGDLQLSRSCVGLQDGASGKRYTPVTTAWGTPDDIRAGRYTTQFSLPSHQAIAGLVVFDVPRGLQKPRLLIRDLAETSTDFTAAVDLTQDKSEGR